MTDPCPCGSGRKFKRCCLASQSAEDSARMRLRGAEGRIVDGTLRFAGTRWGEALLHHAWEDFWNYNEVPEDIFETPEFEQMFLPWFSLSFMPDVEADQARHGWPDRPLAFEWLDDQDDVSELDRRYVEAASTPRLRRCCLWRPCAARRTWTMSCRTRAAPSRRRASPGSRRAIAR